MSIPLVAMLAVLTSCSNPERDFEKAQKVNTEQAYESFIKKHPESSLVAQAKARIEQNAFEAARKAASVPAYEDFLKRFQTGSRASEARLELESLEFSTANKTATADAWRAYLGKYPSSTNAPLARASIADLVLPQVVATNTVQAYEAFRLQYPNTRAATNAWRRIEALDYAAATNANTISDYESFLAKHPASELASDIRDRLLPQVDERDWNQALLQNTPLAFGAYYDAHTNTSRIQCYTGTVRSFLYYSLTERPTAPYQTLQIVKKDASVTEIRGLARVTGVVVSVDGHADFVRVLPVEEAARLELSGCKETSPNTFRCPEAELSKSFESARLFIQKTEGEPPSHGRIMAPPQLLAGEEHLATGTREASERQNAQILKAATNRVGVVDSTRLFKTWPMATNATAELRASNLTVRETVDRITDPEQRRISLEDSLKTLQQRRKAIRESLMATLMGASAKIAQAKGLSMILSGAESPEGDHEVLFANGDEKLVAGLLRTSPALATSLIRATGTVDVTDSVLSMVKEVDAKDGHEEAAQGPPK
jgi:outer membrane protein assembly factor BamD (BamD/ComL family)